MNKYYSPRLDRDLITLLYHEAKARRVPMTKLASALLRKVLAEEPVQRANQDDQLMQQQPART